MKSEQILAPPPRVLNQEQREFYLENGYPLLERFVSREWLDRSNQPGVTIFGSQNRERSA